MKRFVLLAAGAGAAAALAAGCSSSTTASTSASASSGSAAAGASGTGGVASVRTASSLLGRILVDGSGRTLYVFTSDSGGKATCTGPCATIWPPDTTTGTPRASGLPASMLGTTMRPDHITQVTFNGHPLYHFSGDKKPGDVNGQGIQGTWFAVGPSGSALTSASAGGSAPSPSTSSGGGSGGGYGY
jgi:predicted lipoprotein with Yx(FWY)xxD motif